MYNFIHYRIKIRNTKQSLNSNNTVIFLMWNQISIYFSDYPARKTIAQKLLEYGLKVQNDKIYCGEIELSDSKIARAFHVDRRAVTATREIIENNPSLKKIYAHLLPACHLKNVAPLMHWGVIEIIPDDPNTPGILASVATIIAKNNISIRQAIGDDIEFSEEPRLFIVTETPIPGELIPLIRKTNGVKAVLVS